MYQSLVGRPASGVLRTDPERGLVEVAGLMGVVFGLVPVTHPVATFVFKVLIALKARDAVILSCPSRAQQVTDHTGLA